MQAGRDEMTNQSDELHDSQVKLHGPGPEKTIISIFSVKAFGFAIFLLSLGKQSETE